MSQKLMVLDEDIYHYRNRNTSAMNSYKFNMINDMYNKCNLVEKIFSDIKYKDIVKQYKRREYIVAVINCCRELKINNYVSRKKEIKKIRELFVKEKLFSNKKKFRTWTIDFFYSLLEYNMINMILIFGGIHDTLKRRKNENNKCNSTSI